MPSERQQSCRDGLARSKAGAEPVHISRSARVLFVCIVFGYAVEVWKALLIFLLVGACTPAVFCSVIVDVLFSVVDLFILSWFQQLYLFSCCRSCCVIYFRFCVLLASSSCAPTCRLVRSIYSGFVTLHSSPSSRSL